MTTYTYVYYTSGGALYSYAPDSTPVATASQLTAAGLTAVTGQPGPLGVSGMPSAGNMYAWQDSPPEVVTVAVPMPSIQPYILAQQFTGAEWGAIRAKCLGGSGTFDENIDQFVCEMQMGMPITGPAITTALAYLVSQSVITSAQSATITAALMALGV
jgi:hypothetical protein